MSLVGTHNDKQSQSVLVVCEQSQQKRCSKTQFTEICVASLILTMIEYNPLFMMKLFHENHLTSEAKSLSSSDRDCGRVTDT